MIYYLNSKPGGGPGKVKYIANFDFTQSTTDSVNGFIANLINCTRDSSGVHIATSSQYISITQLVGIMTTPVFTIEVDFGACNARNYGENKRLIMWNYEDGFIYRRTGNWCVYNDAWQDSGSTDINAFGNSTLKMKFYNGGKFEVYKNDILFYSDSNIGSSLVSPIGLLIGSNSNSFFDIYVKAVRVYYD